jgi:hypothetical protein
MVIGTQPMPICQAAAVIGGSLIAIRRRPAGYNPGMACRRRTKSAV